MSHSCYLQATAPKISKVDTLYHSDYENSSSSLAQLRACYKMSTATVCMKGDIAAASLIYFADCRTPVLMLPISHLRALYRRLMSRCDSLPGKQITSRSCNVFGVSSVHKS